MTKGGGDRERGRGGMRGGGGGGREMIIIDLDRHTNRDKVRVFKTMFRKKDRLRKRERKDKFRQTMITQDKGQTKITC